MAHCSQAGQSKSETNRRHDSIPLTEALQVKLNDALLFVQVKMNHLEDIFNGQRKLLMGKTSTL